MDKFFNKILRPKSKQKKSPSPTPSSAASTISSNASPLLPNTALQVSNASSVSNALKVQAPSMIASSSTSLDSEVIEKVEMPKMPFPPSPLAQIQNYVFMQTLGKGTYGTVKLALYKPTGAQYAIKIIRKDIILQKKKKLDMVEKEVEVVGRVRHVNIIGCQEWFEAPDKFYLVFELATGGELLERIGNMRTFTESQACYVVATLLNALAFLHDHGVIHRDIKPENVMYKENRPNSPLVLVDFGIAKVLDESPPDGMDPRLLKTVCGSLAYTAPEVLLRRGYSYPVDVYGVGVMLFILVTGRHPFFDREEDIGVSGVIQRICKGIIVTLPEGRIVIPAHLSYLLAQPPPPPFNRLSQDFILFLLKLLSLPDTRPSAHEALNDPWISKWCEPNWLNWLMEVNEWSEWDGVSRAQSRVQAETKASTVDSVQASGPSAEDFVDNSDLGDHSQMDSLPLSEPDLEFQYPTGAQDTQDQRTASSDIIQTLLRSPVKVQTIERKPGDTLNPVGTLRRKTKGKSGNLMETMIRMRHGQEVANKMTMGKGVKMDLDGMGVDPLEMGERPNQPNLLNPLN
jgi:calcium/calmodulin-dependent protein kinase I